MSPLIVVTPATEYRRLTQIFIAVCDLDGAERSRMLDLLCENHPELKPEVELLLMFHDRISAGSSRGDIP
jgi:hypothetical protein